MDWKICDFMTHDRVLAARERFIQPIKNKKKKGEERKRGKNGRKKRIERKKGGKSEKKGRIGYRSTSGVR